ncbi:MAG: hypothetical protein LUE65_13220 [Clostridiales bacterium]|nr:hypothetical protein [Clostridiales bacterium]
MNKRNILVLFAFTFIAVLLFFHMINLQTPSLANGSSMPTDVNRQTYSVTGYDMIKEQDGVTIRFTDTPVDIELALTLSDMGTYHLFVNDRELFSYEKQSIFSRSHCIVIPISYLRNDGVLTIYFQSDSWGKRTAEIVTGRLNAPPKVLIGPAFSAEKANRSSAETIYFMVGMCILLTGSSLLLFFYRMEEISFLLLSLVALLRAFTMIINVPDSIFSLSMELYYLIRPTLVTCPVIFHAAMGIYLLKDAIPKQAVKYFSPFTLLTLTTFALFLQQISSRNWYHMIQAICFGFFFWIAYRACRQKIQGSQLLMAGYAAAAAIILYVYLVNVFYIAPAGQLLTAISITHFSYMITLLSCMACIDIRLIRQFHKVETLSAELVEINQELDRRVIERTNQLVESQQ